jgi:hypothetical protein
MNRHALALAFVAGVTLFFLLFVNCATAEWVAQATATPTSVNHLPVVTRNYPSASQRLQPGDLEYLGAFRLPDAADRPRTLAYGGNAMTFNPNGDPSGAGDGFPGSLFVMGHDRLPYGELPDGNQVAEVSIPAAISMTDVSQLNQATFLQGFHNVAGSFFAGLDEIPRVGIQYLDTPATGPKIHLA